MSLTLDHDAHDGDAHLICDSCGASLASSGAWLRVRQVVTHARTGATRVWIDCEQCILAQQRAATLERLQRLGLAQGLSRKGRTEARAEARAEARDASAIAPHPHRQR